MHNNFYFLRQVSAKLEEKLKGFTLVSCFSQSKDELVIEFNNAKTSLFIRASLLPEFSCLTFPSRFQRARKNSVDLFDQLLMKEVRGVRQFSNERSFAIDLEGGPERTSTLSVVFMMHGNRSNVLVAENGTVTEIFKTSQENDLGVSVNDFDKVIDWSREAFDANIDRLDKLYFTFGKPVWNYLKTKGFYEGDEDQNEAVQDKKWNLIRETVQKLENPTVYWISEYASAAHLVLLEYGTVVAQHTDPFDAVNQFASTYMSQSQLLKKTEQAIAKARQEIKVTQKNLDEAIARLFEIQTEDTFKIWADVLMANLHQVQTGTKSVTLDNFYDDGNPVKIPIDEQLSPQKNAERYYRKSKNRVIEIEKLQESITRLRLRLHNAQEKLSNPQVEEVTPAQSEKETIPFWSFEHKGFTIWAGKDAKNNDELTMKWAHKNDLWLHARDVAGSHVIIRHQAGKNFPKDVIEFAASIAAWNSKRKTESLAPVIVTPRKFVRKKKGAQAGSVIIDREEVILVEPRNPS